jgi:uncharacterized protein
VRQSEQFIDAGYFIALVNTRDALHARARRIASGLQRPQVTTEAILFEVADALAAPPLRSIGVELLPRIRSNPRITTIESSPSLLQRAWDLFAARRDKEWGLTDCLSFVVMQDRGITEALAYDQRFVQAGFRALLRES